MTLGQKIHLQKEGQKQLFNILFGQAMALDVTVQEQYRWDVVRRLDRLRHIGAKNGLWKIGQAEDKVRRTWPGTGGGSTLS
jgi:hypothetical protein